MKWQRLKPLASTFTNPPPKFHHEGCPSLGTCMSQVGSLPTGPPHLTRSQQKDKETLPLARCLDNCCRCNVMLHVATGSMANLTGATRFPMGSPVLRSCNNHGQRIGILSAAGPWHVFAKPPFGRHEEKVKSAAVREPRSGAAWALTCHQA